MSVDGELEEDVGEAAVSDEVVERIEKLKQEKELTKNVFEHVQQRPVRVLSGLNSRVETLLLVKSTLHNAF